MFWLILLGILLVLAIGGGSWGRSRYGGWSWTPAAVILLLAAVLFYTGHISWHG